MARLFFFVREPLFVVARSFAAAPEGGRHNKIGSWGEMPGFHGRTAER
jgi:hypothetical protein